MENSVCITKRSELDTSFCIRSMLKKEKYVFRIVLYGCGTCSHLREVSQKSSEKNLDLESKQCVKHSATNIYCMQNSSTAACYLISRRRLD